MKSSTTYVFLCHVFIIVQKRRCIQRQFWSLAAKNIVIIVRVLNHHRVFNNNLWCEFPASLLNPINKVWASTLQAYKSNALKCFVVDVSICRWWFWWWYFLRFVVSTTTFTYVGGKSSWERINYKNLRDVYRDSTKGLPPWDEAGTSGQAWKSD